jgi:archaellum component FlaC
MSIKIESDLKEVLNRIDQKFDRIDQKLDNIQKDVTSLKVEITDLKGEVKVVDTKVDGLSTRLQNQEFTSRAIFISLVLVILGGAAKMFGFTAPM